MAREKSISRPTARIDNNTLLLCLLNHQLHEMLLYTSYDERNLHPLAEYEAYLWRALGGFKYLTIYVNGRSKRFFGAYTTD